MKRYFDLLIALTLFSSLGAEAYSQTNTGVGRSGRWFTYDGQPTFLVGFDNQELAVDPTIDYTAALDKMVQYRINKVRIWTYVWFGKANGNLTPWAKDANGKHNLDQWNNAYWTRVRDFLSKARDRKIVVEISIFAPYPGQTAWWTDSNYSIAWNKTFNTNGAFSSNSSGLFQPQYFDLNLAEKSTSGKTLKDYQQSLVDKVVSEFGGFQNVYFEVCNEFGTYGLNVSQWYPWQLHWADRLRATTSRLVSAHVGFIYIGDIQYFPQLYWDSSSVDVMTIRTTGSPQQISDYLHSAQLKGKAISLNETTGDFYTDLPTQTRYAWGMFLSGGQTGLYEDDSSRIGSSSWIAGAQRLKALRDIAEKVNFWEMSPVDASGNEYDAHVTQGPSGANRQVLAKQGSQYVVYFWGSSSTTSAVISLPSGAYTYEWYDVKNAALIGSGNVSGGSAASIPAPATSSWDAQSGAALIIKSAAVQQFSNKNLAALGKCLTAQGSVLKSNVVIDQCDGRAFQTWTYTGAKELRNGSLCLDVAAAEAIPHANVQVYTCNNAANQQWEHVGSTFKPLHVSGLGMCLDVTGGSSANGTNVQLYNCNGTQAQTWAVQDPPSVQVPSAPGGLRIVP